MKLRSRVDIINDAAKIIMQYSISASREIHMYINMCDTANLIRERERKRERKYIGIYDLGKMRRKRQFVTSETNSFKNSIHPLTRHKIDESFVRKV